MVVPAGTAADTGVMIQRLYLRAPIGALLVPALLAALLVFEWLMLFMRPFSSGMGQDFTTLYLAALAWRHGADPYVPTVPMHLATVLGVRWQGELELPALLALASPLTLLSPRAAFLLYALLQQALICAGVRLLLPAGQRRIVTLLALSAAPTFLVCYYGQSGALVAAAVAAAWWARRRGYPVVLGLCVGLALCKPQLGACVALPLLWAAPGPRWQRLAGLGVGLSVLLALSLVVVGPAGLLPYLRLAHTFGASAQAATEAAVDGLGLAALPGAVRLVAVLLIAAAGIVLARRGWSTPTELDIAAVCALLVFVLPYSHQYDSVALLPSLAVMRQARPGWGMALVTLLVLTTPLAAVLTVQLPFRPFPLALLLWALLAMPPFDLRKKPRWASSRHAYGGPGLQ